MDLQNPQGKHEDDVLSSPEKDVFFTKASYLTDLSDMYKMLLDYDSRFIEDYYLGNYEISCPQHLKNDLLHAFGECPQNHSTSLLTENKFLNYVNKEKQMNNTGNRFSIHNNKLCDVLDIDFMEPSQRHGIKMASQLQDNSIKIEICVLNGEFGSYGSEDWTETEGKEPLVLVGERFITIKNGVGCIPKITFTDNSRWLRSRKFRSGAKVVQLTSSEENIKEGTSEPFVVKDNRGDLSYKRHYPPFLNDETWRLMKIAKEGQIHKQPSPKGIHTVKDLLQLLIINESSLNEKELCRKESLRALGEYPQNHCKALNESKLLACVSKEKQMNTTGNKFSIDNNKPCVILNVDLMEPSQRHGNKITSQLQDSSTVCNLNKNKHKHKETMPRDHLFQHKRKEIAQHVSFVVILSIMFLGLFFDAWIQPLHKERGPVSIWASLLGLFGFMVFVWAVAITVLVGVPFSRMQSSVLIFWAILMHLKSASSISAGFVPMLGIIFLGVFARGKV